jgi:hypothetical protein
MIQYEASSSKACITHFPGGKVRSYQPLPLGLAAGSPLGIDIVELRMGR